MSCAGISQQIEYYKGKTMARDLATLRHDMAICEVSDDELAAMRQEPRSTWPCGWDIVRSPVSAKYDGDNWQCLAAHFANFYAELGAAAEHITRPNARTYLSCIPADCANMIYDHFWKRSMYTFGGATVTHTYFMGIEHSRGGAPSTISKENDHCVRVWRMFGASRDFMAGPYSSLELKNETQLAYNYNPHSRGEHADREVETRDREVETRDGANPVYIVRIPR